jgi:hypothetical protein
LYEVVEGESLSRIARREFGSLGDWEKLAKWNPQITNPNKIYYGEVIFIPKTEYLANPDLAKKYYAVVSGDTYRRVSEKIFGLDKRWRALSKWNDGKELEPEMQLVCHCVDAEVLTDSGEPSDLEEQQAAVVDDTEEEEVEEEAEEELAEEAEEEEEEELAEVEEEAPAAVEVADTEEEEAEEEEDDDTAEVEETKPEEQAATAPLGEEDRSDEIVSLDAPKDITDEVSDDEEREPASESYPRMGLRPLPTDELADEN